MRLLRISSRDRSLVGGNKYSFNFHTNDCDLHNARRIYLKSAIIPNTQYNINSNNNVFRFTIAGAPSTSTVAVGQYSLATLQTALIARLLADHAITLTITQDSITNKLSFTTNVNFRFLSKTDNNPMGDVLGIYTSSVGDVANFTADGLPNLVGLRHIYIASNTLSNNISMITDDKQKYNIFCDIPITVGFGELQTVSQDVSSFDSTDFGSKKNISTIDIELLDEENNIVDLNGHDFVLVFSIH